MQVTRLQIVTDAQIRTLQKLRRDGAPDTVVEVSKSAFATVRAVAARQDRFGRLRARTLAAAAALLVGSGASTLSGCALVQADWRSEDAQKVQMVITGAIAVDTAQTVQFSRSPECTRERNPLAFGGDAHPSPRDVVAYGIPYAVGHWLLGKWVDQRWSGRWQQKLYWSLTLGGHGAAIGNNFAEGISPIHRYECP